MTSEEKSNVRQILHRLCKQGKLERHPNKNGFYRMVQVECEEIDFMNAPTEGLILRWPGEIERYFKTLPKNIIVIAGEPDAGKTAFLLNFVRLNMERHKIEYFSSEMGGHEFRERLSKFGLPLSEWWKFFKPRERSFNFADVIRPDDINIIDFLEVTGGEGREFYRVGDFIKDIYDKLRKGVAIIALQKNPGTDYGLGGARSLEKARLYLAMYPGRIKIIKAKNVVNGQKNLTGMELDFKLAEGCQFAFDGDWHHERNRPMPGLEPFKRM